MRRSLMAWAALPGLAATTPAGSRRPLDAVADRIKLRKQCLPGISAWLAP